jgi:hypothetical protein
MGNHSCVFVRGQLQTGCFKGGLISQKEPYSMISPIESFGDYLLFRCQVCKTIFDCAAEISKGDRLAIRRDGTGPVNRDFVTIRLRCPRCSEESTYRLGLLEM